MQREGTPVDEEVLAELQRSVSGAVIAPADSGYDGLRRCFNALVDRRPAVIVRCFGARDVRRNQNIPPL